MAETIRVSRFGLVNCYLVPEEDGFTVVDTAITGTQKALLAAAAEAGLPIKRILLTHAHGDHVGSLDALAGAVQDAEVIVSGREAKLLRKDLALEPGEPGSKVRGGFPGASTQPTRTVEHGELVGSLEVIATPGHTPGHIALLDRRDGTLLCGDVFSTLGGVATSAKVNPLFPLPAMATWDRPTELASAKVLRALEPERLAPGHGKIVDSPLAAMDSAIASAS